MPIFNPFSSLHSLRDWFTKEKNSNPKTLFNRFIAFAKLLLTSPRSLLDKKKKKIEIMAMCREKGTSIILVHSSIPFHNLTRSNARQNFSKSTWVALKGLRLEEIGFWTGLIGLKRMIDTRRERIISFTRVK